MSILNKIYLIGTLFSLAITCDAQEIDSSFIGTYAVVSNIGDNDTIGYIILDTLSYAFISYGIQTSENQNSGSRSFMQKPIGEYEIQTYAQDDNNDPSYLIDFDPLNTDRTWRQTMYSVYGLRKFNGSWILKDNTSRSFPALIFFKL
ncbi:MAG: hypothetical protein QNK23_08590 [Crocinitomicaceae bacterium]|nr:hypothetical protein [Crocinitomicaceae bacterium]